MTLTVPPTRTGPEITAASRRASTLERGTPAWWLDKLSRRLDRRRAAMRRGHDYYHGRHVLKLISEQFREQFSARFPEFADNFMPLVVDTENDRLEVQGIRFGDDQQSDRDAWAWWQRNELDLGSKLANREALTKGTSNLLVWADEGQEPTVTIIDGLEMVVHAVHGRPWDRKAALNRWLDDDGTMVAELYLPDGIHRFRTTARDTDFSSLDWASAPDVAWLPTSFNGIGFVPNPIGVVPVVALINRPELSRLDTHGRLIDGDDGESELVSVTGNQDYINAYRMMAVVASEYASWRQRWIIGLELPNDPKTGDPMPPPRIGVDRMLLVPPPDPELYPDATKAPKVELGEFDQTDVAGLVSLIRLEVGHLSSKSRTPYHYFLGESQTVPPSGESLKSSETGLVSKVVDAMVGFDHPYEEVFRLRSLFAGDDAVARAPAELVWKVPESRNEAVLSDTLVKLKGLGVADELLQEMYGMSPQQIERNKAAIEAERAAAPPAPPQGPPTMPGTMPPTDVPPGP